MQLFSVSTSMWLIPEADQPEPVHLPIPSPLHHLAAHSLPAFQQRVQPLFGSLARQPSQVGQSGECVPFGTLGKGVFELTQARFLPRFGPRFGLLFLGVFLTQGFAGDHVFGLEHRDLPNAWDCAVRVKNALVDIQANQRRVARRAARG